LKELRRLLKQKKLALVLPAQTRDEYRRNRNGIADQSGVLLVGEIKRKLVLPAPFVTTWPETKRVRKHVELTKKSYQALVKRYDDAVSAESTPADILINRLFAAAESPEEDEDLLKKAHFRYLRGHPPRKNDGSLGDAIAWELLLEKINDDLVIVSRDSDFAETRRRETSLNAFMAREWRGRRPGKSAKLFVSLGEFINTFEKREAVKKTVVDRERTTEVSWPVVPTFNFPSLGANATFVIRSRRAEPLFRRRIPYS
jgi:hypothetical protein